MTDRNAKKALELRALASEFRAKADETQLLEYIELMLRSAAELDGLAEQMERSAVVFARAS